MALLQENISLEKDIEELEEELCKLQAKVKRKENQKLMKWINVKDRLPEDDLYVLWWHESGHIIHADIPHDAGKGYMAVFLEGNHLIGPITHWALPESPNPTV